MTNDLPRGACASKKNILLWAGVKLRQFRTIVLGQNELEGGGFVIAKTRLLALYFIVIVFRDDRANVYQVYGFR